MVVTKVLIVSELFSSLYRALFSDMNSQCRLGLYFTLILQVIESSLYKTYN